MGKWIKLIWVYLTFLKRKKRNLPLSNNVDSLLHGEEISPNLLHTSDLAFKSENKSLNNVNAVPSLANTNEEESKIVDDSVETLSPSKVIFLGCYFLENTGSVW
mgnify:CR=1 FL=1